MTLTCCTNPFNAAFPQTNPVCMWPCTTKINDTCKFLCFHRSDITNIRTFWSSNSATRSPKSNCLLPPCDSPITQYPEKSRSLRQKDHRNGLVKMSKGLAELLGFEYSKYNNIILPIEEKSSTDLQPRSDVANNVVETLFELPYGQVELIPFNSYSYTVSNVSDLQRDFYSLYFYCDIVAPTVVGDVKVPLMRCVNISGNHEKTVDRIYETAHYVPLHRKQFDTIDINIREDAGKSVPFQRGKVIVTLHFRMKKPPFFWIDKEALQQMLLRRGRR